MKQTLSKSSKIYIAGHTGMVGSAISRRLKFEGYNNLITRTHSQLDLTNQEAVHDFFQSETIDYVVMAAAKVGGIHANNTYPADFIYNNIMIEANIIHEAYKAGVERLLFLGSSCIYPMHAPQPMKEEYLLTGQLEPTNEPYGIAKIAGIKLCESYNRQYGTKYRPVMPTNLYGPNDNYDLNNSHVLPALIRKFHLAKLATHGDWEAIKRDEQTYGPIPADIMDSLVAISRSHGHSNKIPTNNHSQLTINKPQSAVVLWGTGTPRREFLHVDDVASAYFFIMKLDDSTFNSCIQPMLSHINVGTGKDMTISELSETIKKVVGYNGEVIWDQTKPDGMPKKLLNASKLNSLGWKPEISLIEGIRTTYKEYLKK